MDDYSAFVAMRETCLSQRNKDAMQKGSVPTWRGEDVSLPSAPPPPPSAAVVSAKHAKEPPPAADPPPRTEDSNFDGMCKQWITVVLAFAIGILVAKMK